MAYLFVPFPTTSDDLEGHSPNDLMKCNLKSIGAKFSTVLTDMDVAQSLGDSGASCRSSKKLYTMQVRWHTKRGDKILEVWHKENGV